MEYTIEYVELEHDIKPFKEFTLSLSLKERAKLFETINYFLELENNSLLIKENLSKHLDCPFAHFSLH